jgi:hypothetical protein
LPFRAVRKFIVDFLQIELIEALTYSALLAPCDHVFYQPLEGEGSDWPALNAVTEYIEV